MTENWKPVVGFESHYEISDLGNVVSIRNNHGNPRRRALKAGVTRDGYLRVELSKGGEQTKKHVAHMVLEAFVGPRPAGMQACHGPAGQKDNSLTNLRWDTPASNYQDRINAGSLQGEKHHQCSIDEATARSIKKMAADKTILARDIATKFGTTVHVVRNIRNNKSWAWL